MLGGYTVVVTTNAGVDLWFAMLVLAPLIVGLIGVIVERLLIRRSRQDPQKRAYYFVEEIPRNPGNGNVLRRVLREEATMASHPTEGYVAVAR